MSIFLAFVLYAVWTTIFPLAKLNLEHAPPLFLVGARMLIGGAIILFYLLVVNRAVFKIVRKHSFSLFILAVISVYVANVLECRVLENLSAAKTCFIYSLSPFFSVLFSYFHFHETLNLRKCIGLVIGFTGILPVLYVQKGNDEILTLIPLISWSELSVIGAVASSVYGWILLRKIIKDLPPSVTNGITMVIGGILALIHSFFTEGWDPIPVPRTEWAAFGQILAIMIAVSNLFCYNLYGMLLKRFTVTVLSFIGLFSPIFASISSWLILGEAPSFPMYYSTVILFIGLWIVYSEELKQGYMSDDKPQTAN